MVSGTVSDALKFSLVTALAGLSAVVSAETIATVAGRMPQFRAATAEVAPAPAPAADPGPMAVAKSSDGHYWVNAVVNEKAVKFLVDTGATVVALTPADAQRLGFNAGNLVFDQKISTANGQTLGARVTLVTVGVGQSEVQNVDAMVIKEGLSTSLLGMSYLGRLSRFEATRTALILRP